MKTVGKWWDSVSMLVCVCACVLKCMGEGLAGLPLALAWWGGTRAEEHGFGHASAETVRAATLRRMHGCFFLAAFPTSGTEATH